MFKQRSLAALVISAGCIWAGCNQDNTAKAPAFDMAAARKQIDSANQNLVTGLAKGDSTLAAESYCKDAKFMAANAPALSGRKEISGDFGNLIRSGITDLKITTVDVWGGENAITEEGKWTLALKDGKQVDQGKYLVLWKKEDGKWKIFRDCLNSDMPAAAH